MVTAATRRGRTIRSNLVTEDVATNCRPRRDRRCRHVVFFFFLLPRLFGRARLTFSGVGRTRLAPHHRTTERVRKAHDGKQEATG